MKNLDLITSLFDTESKKKTMNEISPYIYMPYQLFMYNGEYSDIGLLRNAQDQTEMLLSARSVQEILKKVSDLELDVPKGEQLSRYFYSVACLYSKHSVLSCICPFCPGVDAKAVLQHVKDIVNRNVTKALPEFSEAKYKFFSKVSQEIAKDLKEENETDEELKKWADFNAAYEKLNHGGGSS